MKITLKQKRFLIIWILIHSFALFVNLENIRGKIPSEATISYDNYHTKFYNDSYVYLFTTGTYAFGDDFWPFTTFYSAVSERPHYSDGVVNTVYFNGIFNAYKWPAYFFYLFLGFAVIYLPKIWEGKQRPQNKD